MRFVLICSLFIFSSIFVSCSKKNNDSFTIKYEITTTAAVSGSNSIITKIGLQESVTYRDFTTGTSWSKSVVAETAYRPLTISMNPQTIVLSSPGSATTNLYVNGALKATSTTNSNTSGGVHMVSIAPIQFTVQ